MILKYPLREVEMIDIVIHAMRKDLAAACNSDRRLRVCLSYETVPLNIDPSITYDGIPIRRLTTPEVCADAAENENLFAAWVQARMVGGKVEALKNAKTDLAELGSDKLAAFVTQGRGIGEQAVRLLAALGNAIGARVDYDESGILIHHGGRTYGIKDGVVRAMFCDGIKLPVEPARIMSHTETRCSRNTRFNALLVEARRLNKKELIYALVALKVSDPRTGWGRVVGPRPTVVPKYEAFKKFDRILNQKVDPLGKLYALLVPFNMTDEQFTKLLVRVNKRAMVLSEEQKAEILRRLGKFFYRSY